MLIFYDRKQAGKAIKQMREIAEKDGCITYAKIKELNLAEPEPRDYEIKFRPRDIDYFFIVPDKYGTGFFRICTAL